MNVLGIDPGREKTGVAVVSEDGAVRWRAVIETPELSQALKTLVSQWEIARIALGDSTSSSSARAQIEALMSDNGWKLSLEIVDETNSTREARALYFEENPPRGWRKWLSLSQVPPVPVDDFAAVVVARRWLQSANN